MSEVATEKQQFWLDHLEAAEGSGKSIADYAREHNLGAQRLYQWRHVMKKNTTTVATEAKFTRVVTRSPPGHSRLSINLPGTKLEFSALPDPHWLSSLLCVLIENR